MKIITNFENNTIPKQYGKHADEENKLGGIPVTSFPFSVEEVPAEAKYLHILLIDYDAIPVIGFPFIHWTVANIDANQTSFPENWSRDESTKTQGINSYASILMKDWAPNQDEVKNIYVGPGAPDKDHDYELIVYATEEKLNLEEGFLYNDMRKALDGKYIAKSKQYLIGKA